MKMIPLGLLFQTLICFLEQHRPIPHLGQRYVQESCNTALSKQAPDLAQCQPWSDYQFSDDQQQYSTTPAVCHLPGTRESALMYYLMQPVWSMQLLVKNSFQSGTKSWQQSTHNGSCRVSYWENCLTIGSWLVPRAVLPHSLTAVSRHHVLALWRTGSWAQCASWEHRLALPVCTLLLSERCIFLSPVSNSADCAQEHPRPISSSFPITLNIHLF